MIKFESLAEAVEYIKEGEDVQGYTWNNDAGNWDIDDILYNVSMYDEQYNEYYVDVETYDIYDGNNNILFERI